MNMSTSGDLTALVLFLFVTALLLPQVRLTFYKVVFCGEEAG
jgi:hypothetical protein